MMNSLLHPVQQATIGRHQILAVDDDEDNLLLLLQALERFDRSLLAASDGATALMLAKTFQPTLILLDIVLPDISGFDVLRHLKQNSKTAAIPVIAVTALAKAEDRQQLIQSGCHDCISKPYLLEDLEQAVDHGLQLAALSCT